MTILLFFLSFIINYPIYSAKRTNVKRAGIASKNTTQYQKRSAVSSTSSNLSSKRIGARGKQTKTPITNNTSSNNEKTCPVCPDCNTSTLRTEISSLNSENANLKNEIENLKIQKEELIKTQQKTPEEPVLSQTEEKARLEKLRIQKVSGSTDDYKCIDGWTNNWDEKLLNINKEIADSKVMDKYGVIKDEAERVKWGKFKKGCPIKSKIEINENKYNYNTYLYLYKFNKENKQYEYMKEFIKPQLKPIAIVNLYMDSFPNIMERPWEKITPKLIFSYFFDKSHSYYMHIIPPKNVNLKEDIFDDWDRPFYIGVIFKKNTQVKNISFDDIVNEKYTILTFPVNYTDITFYDSFDYYNPVINPAIYPFWDYDPDM
ncbi:hypothetical protein HDR60_00005 [bacterium]|nr:hypothetical protein [bacterium]